MRKIRKLLIFRNKLKYESDIIFRNGESISELAVMHFFLPRMQSFFMHQYCNFIHNLKLKYRICEDSRCWCCSIIITYYVMCVQRKNSKVHFSLNKSKLDICPKKITSKSTFHGSHSMFITKIRNELLIMIYIIQNYFNDPDLFK